MQCSKRSRGDWRCPREAVAGRRTCQFHYESVGRSRLEHDKRAKAAGVCTGCGEPSDGKRFCRRCTLRQYNWRRNLKHRVLVVLGETACARCGVDDVDVLTVDHVDEDGAAHRREIRTAKAPASSYRMYHDIIRNGTRGRRFQVLCANCHLRKGLATDQAKLPPAWSEEALLLLASGC